MYEAAKNANVEVIIATPNEEIYKLIKSVNGISVKTNPNHETGIDKFLKF